MEGYLGRHQGFYALMFLRWFNDWAIGLRIFSFL
jgi:hypothetical protein